MGHLENGQWSDKQFVKHDKDGGFVRADSGFRNWITADGSAGPTGEGGFKAEADRYHLYVAMACPWANRSLIFRKLKGLEDLISISVVDPKMPNETGWQFSAKDGGTVDHLHGSDYLWQVYAKANPNYTGRVTVPTLWDKQKNTIVSNESADIIRMFNSAFSGLTGNTHDYYPEPLHDRIHEINDRVYDAINNGVYKAGFATTQKAYEKAAAELFDALDWVEGLLDSNKYLTGDALTEADWRLFVTLVRFDAVYYSHFKCSRRRIADYKNLSRYLKELYDMPGISDTIDLDQIRLHYFWSHDSINPTRIVPIMPELSFLS